MRHVAALFCEKNRKSAAPRSAVEYGFDPIQMGEQFFFNMAFLDDVVDKRLLAAAFQLALVRQIPQTFRYFSAVIHRSGSSGRRDCRCLWRQRDCRAAPTRRLILLSYHEALGVSIERKTISKNNRRARLVFRTSSGAAEREANFRSQGRASALEAVAKSSAVSRL